MIKQETLRIGKLTTQSRQFHRFDFVQKDVDRERKLVHLEEDLNRVKLKVISHQELQVKQ